MKVYYYRVRFCGFIFGCSTQYQLLPLWLDPLADDLGRPRFFPGARGLHEHVGGHLILLRLLQHSIHPIIVLIAMNALRHQITLRNSLGASLLLAVQEALIVEVGFLGMIADGITAQKLFGLLLAGQKHPLGHFLACVEGLACGVAPGTSLIISGRIGIIRDFMCLPLLVVGCITATSTIIGRC